MRYIEGTPPPFLLGKRAIQKCGMATEEGKGFGLIESHYDNANDDDKQYHENLHGEYVLISKKL